MLLLGVLAVERVALAGSPSVELAADLFAEGRWLACIRECERASLLTPAQLAPRVLGAIARLRLGEKTSEAITQLEQVTGTATNELAALSAFETGRARWRQGDATNAYLQVRTAFRMAGQPELFALSGCLLAEILRQFPSLGKDDAALFQTLETCRPLWTTEIVRDALGLTYAGDSVTVRWIVALYRSGIRPAIGSRCSLTPSCSEYFLQAGKAHGLLAFPIVADRLVREPGVVQDAEHPVQVGEHIRYADPLAEHDYWLRAKGTK
ncbi:MAG: membrane protein insertion efficiency factor YidD [Kiritimatiellaeota bacterium]|nr:membrane protein insertion efficiency factor YidD [Kiritimatiellota bacterium]